MDIRRGLLVVRNRVVRRAHRNGKHEQIVGKGTTSQSVQILHIVL